LEYSLGLLLDLRLNSTVNCCGLHNHNVLHTQHNVKAFSIQRLMCSYGRDWKENEMKLKSLWPVRSHGLLGIWIWWEDDEVRCSRKDGLIELGNLSIGSVAPIERLAVPL
jgi:hypothetical protein